MDKNIVLQYIKEHPGASSKQIAEALAGEASASSKQIAEALAGEASFAVETYF